MVKKGREKIVAGCKAWFVFAIWLTIGSLTGLRAQELASFDDFDEEFNRDKPAAVWDPLIGYNRVMFQVNDKLYFWLFKPVATGYGKVVPEPGRLAVKRCFANLGFPARLVNNLFQLKLKEAGTECARFGVNTTVGLLGLFDPAHECFGLNPSDEDFGQTLGKIGVGDGIPLVLPILGMSNLRDLVGRAADSFLDPVNYLEHADAMAALRAYEPVNNLSLYLGEYEDAKQAALDPYILFRDAYRQNREKKLSE